MYDHAKAAQSLFAGLGARAKIARSFPEPAEILRPEQDGFLMAADFNQAVELWLVVTVPKNRNVRTVIVRSFTENKSIVPKKDKATENKPYRQFQKIVKSRATRDATMSTKHDVNNIRLVVAENGIFQMWEIAVPTRIIGSTANFFLTIQRLYKATMYNLNGQIHISEHEYAGYREWTDLQMLLAEMVSLESLQKISRPLEAPQASPVANGSHRVIFFCLASGLGLAQTNKGPAFIHWKELPRQSRFNCVSEGQMINGDTIETEKGLQLKNIGLAD